MDLNSLLTVVGAAGFFASRAFSTALLAALALRFGDSLPLLKNVELIKAASANPPTWFTADSSLVVMAVLAAAEIFGDKLPELQEILNQVQKYMKPVIAGLATFGIISTADAGFIQQNVPAAAALGYTGEVYQAGFLSSLMALVVGGVTFVLSWVRDGLMDILAEADPDDSMQMRRLLSFLEDFWAGFGFLFLLFYPLFILAVIGLFYGLLALWNWRQNHKEEQSRQPCGSCGTLMRPAALCCPKCFTANPTPMGLTWLGAMDNVAAEPPEDHRLLLAEKKRCPCCAKRLPDRAPRQFCPECGKESFADSEFVGAYLGHLNLRLMLVLGVCTALSFIPVFGLIIGVMYYRAKLVSPLRCYLSFGRSFFLRLFLKFFHLALVIFQIVPVLGAASVPLMALTSYLVYKGAFKNGLEVPAKPRVAT